MVDITRGGKGLVDTLFQAPMGTGTHHAVLSSYEYISQGIKHYDLDNKLDGFYIAPAFMDKLIVHITKNFLKLHDIKVPLILGIWGGKGQGKSFQCELVFRKMGIKFTWKISSQIYNFIILYIQLVIGKLTTICCLYERFQYRWLGMA